MKLSNFNQKDKFLIFLVAVFLFLSLFHAAYLFYEIPDALIFIWAVLYTLVLVFSGVIYGFLTKIRGRSLVLGVSFPLLFYIFLRITIAYYRFMHMNEMHPYTHVFYSSISFLLPSLIIAGSNAIACWFVSMPEKNNDDDGGNGDGNDYPVSLSGLFTAISSFLNKDNNYPIVVSSIFMGISLLVTVIVVFVAFVPM